MVICGAACNLVGAAADVEATAAVIAQIAATMGLNLPVGITEEIAAITAIRTGVGACVKMCTEKVEPHCSGPYVYRNYVYGNNYQFGSSLDHLGR